MASYRRIIAHPYSVLKFLALLKSAPAGSSFMLTETRENDREPSTPITIYIPEHTRLVDMRLLVLPVDDGGAGGLLGGWFWNLIPLNNLEDCNGMNYNMQDHDSTAMVNNIQHN
jgi:hypothetical protein